MTLFRLPVLLVILAVFPLHAAPTDAGAPVTVDQLMTVLRSVRHVEARYIEHRYLRVLRTPIETRGTLRFDAPARLEKASDPAADGTAERLTIDGDRLTIDRGRAAAPVVLALHQHPEIGVLVESILATLSGSGDALRRSFDVTASGSIAEWQLELKPRAQQDIMRWTWISGHSERITAIATQDGDGDRSEMSIVELTR